MYSDIFCKVYNEFGWNYYPEIFGEELQLWMEETGFAPGTALDLACGTGILCRILRDRGIAVRGMDFSSGMIAVARENCPDIPFDVADMITYRPDGPYDLVTCTGDAVNHIPDPADVEKIFRNVHHYLAPGGYFIFDLLNEGEVSTSEPFETDFDENTRIWFQMTRPGENKVNLCIRVWEQGEFQFEENIRETLHDPDMICRLLREAGLEVLRCAGNLRPEAGVGTTWFIIARKPQ